MTPAQGRGPGAVRVLGIALPVVLSNMTTPLQGAFDVAVIGALGSETPLAAVGLGAQLFALLFGVFNFLQIGSSGLSAQALGAGDRGRVLDVGCRALLVAAAIAAALILLQGPLLAAGLSLFEASTEAERLAAVYFTIRIWGAPAELANYALMGWFSGQEMTRRLFQHQLVVSCSNIALNLAFVFGLGMGVEGVAFATLAAAWIGLCYGLWLARGRMRTIVPTGWTPDPARLIRGGELTRLMRLNRDIFIRTLCLIGAFAWMTRLGSNMGDAVLAANVVLWQFFELTAYALDGFAIAAETLVGQAAGAGDPRALRRAVVATSLWSGALAVGFSAALLVLHGPLIDLFTSAPEARALAREFALWAALAPAFGFAAFQLDGIFVGATAAREMRDAMLIATGAFVPAAWLATQSFGNHGLWAALLGFLALRAATLLALYPRIEARTLESPAARTSSLHEAEAEGA
jgi:MATE family multidrug resistance protein